FAKPEELPYYAYIAVQSALIHNPGYRAIFHFHHEPTGIWWEKTKLLVEQNRLEDFDYFRGARLHHYAHKADVVRLLALNIIGGVYVDIDTLTLDSFEPLRRESFVLAAQPTTVASLGGLCNAVIVSGRSSPFSHRWLKEYDHFRSRGRDKFW